MNASVCVRIKTPIAPTPPATKNKSTRSYITNANSTRNNNNSSSSSNKSNDTNNKISATTPTYAKTTVMGVCVCACMCVRTCVRRSPAATSQLQIPGILAIAVEYSHPYLHHVFPRRLRHTRCNWFLSVPRNVRLWCLVDFGATNLGIVALASAPQSPIHFSGSNPCFLAMAIINATSYHCSFSCLLYCSSFARFIFASRISFATGFECASYAAAAPQKSNEGIN